MKNRRTTRGPAIALVLASMIACAKSEAPPAGSEESPQKSPEEDPEEKPKESPPPGPGGGELSGTVNEAPFVTRGVLAHRLRASDPTVEIRLMSREASCTNFEEDYKGREDEPVVVIYLKWPRSKGDTVSLGASRTEERLQFCRGRGGERGRVRCEPRAPEQGSLTVLDAGPEGGTLAFDVSSPKGQLSGSLPFTLCEP